MDRAILHELPSVGTYRALMREIAGWVDRKVPVSGHASLLADGDAHRRYEQFGFALTAPASVGMGLRKGRSG